MSEPQKKPAIFISYSERDKLYEKDNDSCYGFIIRNVLNQKGNVEPKIWESRKNNYQDFPAVMKEIVESGRCICVVGEKYVALGEPGGLQYGALREMCYALNQLGPYSVRVIDVDNSMKKFLDGDGVLKDACDKCAQGECSIGKIKIKNKLLLPQWGAVFRSSKNWRYYWGFCSH